MVDFSVLSKDPVLSRSVFGNTLFQYMEMFAILLATLVVAKVLYYLVKRYVQGLAAKNGSSPDELLIKALETPFVLFVLIIGLNLSVAPLTLPTDIAGMFSNLIKVLLILNAAAVVAAVVDVLFDEFLMPYAKKSASKLDEQLLPVLKNCARAIVFALTVLTIVSNFGYDVSAVLVGLVIAGIAIGIAAQDSLSNVIGSAALFTDRPFEMEDLVQVDGVTGKVEDIGIRSTRIRTVDGTLVSIPNATVARASVENYTKSAKRRVQLKLGLEYNTTGKKISKAKDIVRDILRNTRGVDPDDVAVHFIDFADSQLQLMLTYHIVETSRMFDVQDEVNSRIKDEFEKARIEFALPSRAVYVKD